MAEYRMKDGSVLTDADFERMADEAERGIYPGVAGEWVVKPQGRPKMADDDLVVVTCKITRSQRDAIDSDAKRLGQSRSEWMRSTFSQALGQR